MAIGGLIFLMVFIALPALQRSQRNTQRRDDLARVMSAVVEYQKHNSGQTPFFTHGSGGGSLDTVNKFVMRYLDTDATEYVAAYYDDAATGCTDAFKDPDGNCYGFKTVASAMDSLGEGEEKNFYDTISASTVKSTHYFLVIRQAECGSTEEHVAKKVGNNSIAILYIYEGDSLGCVDNS